jgi:methionyl-tRNA formyltransferase
MMEPLPRLLVLAGEPLATPVLATLQRLRYEPNLVITDTKLTNDELLEQIETEKIGLILVAGYGKILKQTILDSVAGQVLNIHPSLLPEYRGPSPVVSAIRDGIEETGVTLIELDAQMDHGPILAQLTYRMRGNETADELHTLLAERGTELFMQHVREYLSETIHLAPQIEEDAHYCHFILKSEGLLQPETHTPEEMERMVRAFVGWPGTWIETPAGRLAIHKAHLTEGAFIPDIVQLAGKKPMSFRDYARGKHQDPDLLAAELFPEPIL